MRGSHSSSACNWVLAFKPWNNAIVVLWTVSISTITCMKNPFRHYNQLTLSNCLNGEYFGDDHDDDAIH